LCMDIQTNYITQGGIINCYRKDEICVLEKISGEWTKY